MSGNWKDGLPCRNCISLCAIVRRGSYLDVSSFIAKEYHHLQTSNLLHLRIVVNFLSSHMNCLGLRILLRPAPRLIRKPTLTLISIFKPAILRHQPSPCHYSTATTMETNNKDLELSNLFDVKGKVALVTGGGRSILQLLLP